MDYLTCLLIDCGKKAKSSLTKELQKLNMTCRQALVLRALDQVVLSAKQLTKLTAIDKATLSVMLKKMAEHGFVNISSSDEDKREKHYELTNKGQKVLPQIKIIEDQFKKQIFGNLSEKEYEILRNTLTSVKDNL